MNQRDELKTRMSANLGMDPETIAWIDETVSILPDVAVEQELDFYRAFDQANIETLRAQLQSMRVEHQHTQNALIDRICKLEAMSFDGAAMLASAPPAPQHDNETISARWNTEAQGRRVMP